MKTKISIIVSAALLSAALAVFVCTNVTFDNPLDEKGTNFLEGRAKDTNFDVAGALKPDSNGVASYYTDTAYKRCDGTVPEVKLVGPQIDTINTQDFAKFNKWMRLAGGQWSELISWDEAKHKGAFPKDPVLKMGTTVINVKKDSIPGPGVNYVIDYKIEKPICNGRVPENTVSRRLIIEQYVAPDTATPKLTLNGKDTVAVKDGEKYADEGVVYVLGGQNINITGNDAAGVLDSVVVKRGSAVEQKLTKPVDVSKIEIKTSGLTGYRYTITYYATAPNGKKAAPATRTVNVIEAAPPAGLPEAVIVLNTYSYKVGGKTINHPDTAMKIGDKNTDYREKGVKEVYYMKDGKKETVSASLVEITPPSGRQSIESTNEPAERKFSYKLSDGAGYKGVTVTRTVYMTDNDCDVANSPTVKLLPSSGAIEIPAGVEWKYNGSWEVANTDIVQSDAPNRYGNAGFQYLIDFDGGKLDPKSPAVGTYTVTYVGLGKCGKMSDPATRSVTVK